MTVGSVPVSASESPTIYFLKHSSMEIEALEDEAEMDRIMARNVEHGSLRGNSLHVLERLINDVFLPLLTISHDLAAQAGANGEAPPPEVAAVGDDFIASLAKFGAHVRRTIQHIEGEISLDIPEALPSIVAAAQTGAALTPAQLDVMRPALESWRLTCVNVLDDISKKTHSGPSPQAEIEFWSERNTVLTALAELLEGETVVKTVALLRELEPTAMENFDFNVAQLTRLRTEAKDNVRFLSTLERHFKHLAQCPSFAQVTEQLPSLLNALRMVWVISRHYNTDARMVPLMSRIAWLICNKVSRHIDARRVLSQGNFKRTMAVCVEAREFLLAWEDTYLDVRGGGGCRLFVYTLLLSPHCPLLTTLQLLLRLFLSTRQVRATIESQGRDARWEFDRGQLFFKTKYMANICKVRVGCGVRCVIA